MSGWQSGALNGRQGPPRVGVGVSPRNLPSPRSTLEPVQRPGTGVGVGAPLKPRRSRSPTGRFSNNTSVPVLSPQRSSVPEAGKRISLQDLNKSNFRRASDNPQGRPDSPTKTVMQNVNQKKRVHWDQQNLISIRQDMKEYREKSFRAKQVEMLLSRSSSNLSLMSGAAPAGEGTANEVPVLPGKAPIMAQQPLGDQPGDSQLNFPDAMALSMSISPILDTVSESELTEDMSSTELLKRMVSQHREEAGEDAIAIADSLYATFKKSSRRERLGNFGGKTLRQAMKAALTEDDPELDPKSPTMSNFTEGTNSPTLSMQSRATEKEETFKAALVAFVKRNKGDVSFVSLMVSRNGGW
uniref:Uncharacterized protein n=1 Tax=Chromera velia CCMP2878 TaxID=1169474 RepID=A0A0G4FY57_9ALVE|eukprot:Cvel_3892.t1-p1 / transcript=Cvel_3892.t1 / gene=Cvel_3892 / organism=Chromera_velia_CCMP2878 / gene_product=hypothetical protein / transcript_product=hypothetical protein / location=Cvel_scaffold165:5911-6972(-) / protein_length=354 / sequence_SO=supercontig / SO=protein_coding / is_pseudo=false